MNVVRDVLDNQLVDQKQRKIGKVDGIVIELYEDGPPRLAAVKVGVVTLGRRLHPRIGAWLAGLGRRWGVNHGEPFRIPFAKVRNVGIDVEVDLDAEQLPVFAWERWLRDHIVARIPGGG